jgi:hypothetical protein
MIERLKQRWRDDVTLRRRSLNVLLGCFILVEVVLIALIPAKAFGVGASSADSWFWAIATPVLFAAIVVAIYDFRSSQLSD